VIKALISPKKYLQGPGVLKDIGKHASRLGKSMLIVGGPTALRCTRETMEQSFREKEVECAFETFNGECTQTEIDRLAETAVELKAEIIGGAGGGKAIDTAKAVADKRKLPVVVIPTIAASDAPCSALSVLYTEEGKVEKYVMFAQNPDLVLVDTEIIARAPVRTLVAGMGDALATKFEAEAVTASFSRNLAGGVTTQTALQLARLCYQILIEDGIAAMASAERKAVTPSLERVVEANILMSGIGFESSGLAAAHAIFDGISMLPQAKALFHGEKVAFSTLVQIVLEGRDRESFEEVFVFCKSVGLPTNLDELGLTGIGEAELQIIAERSCAKGMTIHNIGREVKPREVIDAIKVVDELSNRYEL